jgi:V/A-type H+-transporting ATPase subunit C
MEMNFLAAMLHGRRSRLAEADRLDALCRIRSFHELARTLYPDEIIPTAAALQRRMVADLLNELDRLAGGTAEDRRGLLRWMRVRFQVENLKVLARGRSTGTALAALEPFLIALPRDLALDAPQLLAAGSADAFFALIPNPVLRTRLLAIDETCRTRPGPFHLEAALDHADLSELADRVRGIAGEDRDPIVAVIRQEVDLFHLMLVVRGRFGYGLNPETLRGLHVQGGGLTRKCFDALLDAADLETVAQLADGRVIDARPKKPAAAELEALAWNRLLRLANLAFRKGHMSMGAVIGYALLRRIELANLITLCEGIRTATAPAALRARLIPRPVAEAAHV